MVWQFTLLDGAENKMDLCDGAGDGTYQVNVDETRRDRLNHLILSENISCSSSLYAYIVSHVILDALPGRFSDTKPNHQNPPNANAKSRKHVT